MPPRVKGEVYAQLIMPGEAPAMVSYAMDQGLSGIAARTRPAKRPRHASRVDLDPGLAAEFGITVSSLDVAFGIVDDHHLLRVARSGTGVDSALWRVFGMPIEDRRAAVLAQRAAEPWADAYTKRADAVAPLGKVYPKSAAWGRTLYALIALADAARVIAERTRRADDLRSARD